MTVFMIETYVVKPEKLEECQSLMQRFLEYQKRENPKLFKEVKSFCLLHQVLGV